MGNGWKLAIGLGVVVALGLVIHWLANRQESAAPQRESLHSLALAPGSYNNEEITEIEWNSDGFPVKIIRHRKATRT
jgi:hypothetical protein